MTANTLVGIVTAKQIERACELTRDFKAKSVTAYGGYPAPGWLGLNLEVSAPEGRTTRIVFGINPDGEASS